MRYDGPPPLDVVRICAWTGCELAAIGEFSDRYLCLEHVVTVDETLPGWFVSAVKSALTAATPAGDGEADK